MQSVSLFEQLTSSVSLSMLAIVSGAILALLLISTVACRLFFSSTKSKSISSNNKEKKSNTKKQLDSPATTNKKKPAKAKKNVVAASSSGTQSDESEDEKATLVTQTKKSTPASKLPIGAKVTTVSTKQQQQAPVRTSNGDEQNGDNKKKQAKTSGISTIANGTVTASKQQTTGKNTAVGKINGATVTTNSNKKQPTVTNSEVKQTPVVDGDAGSDQEDEGQWVMQNNKQVNNRNRNKGKPETSNFNTQSSALPTRATLPEKRSVPSTSTSHTVSSTNKTELDIEPTAPSTNPIRPAEPIEICQLMPTSENRYTADDHWWKQPLNKQQTFSVDDISEWPEREQDEQYIVQVKRIVPVHQQNDD